MPPHIHTQRLLLRPFTTADIPDAYQMNLNPKVSRFTGDGGVLSLDEVGRRIKEDVLGDYQKHGFGRFAVEWKATGQFIGFAGLKYLDDLDEIDLGYRFLPAFWGRGIATEAGQVSLEYAQAILGQKRIIAWVLPENKGSIRVLEKLTFSMEKEQIEDGMRVLQYAWHA